MKVSKILPGINVRRVTVGYNSMDYYPGHEPGGMEKRDRGWRSWAGKYRAKAAREPDEETLMEEANTSINRRL